MKKRKITPGGILYACAAGIWLITTIFPLYFAVLSSFKDDQTIFADFLPCRSGLDWIIIFPRRKWCIFCVPLPIHFFCQQVLSA